MGAQAQSDPLRQVQGEMEGLIHSLRHPVLVEGDAELMDLTAAQWRLTAEFGKLIFTAWNAAKSLSRRVEEIAYRDRDRFGVFVRKPGAFQSTTLEFRELYAGATVQRGTGRVGFHQQLVAMIERDYRGGKIERVSHRSDREHSFSAWYTRGMVRQGRSAWAFLGLSEEETPAAADNVLAFGLIWWDWLRHQTDRLAVTELKLFLPPQAVSVTAHRAAYLNPHAIRVGVYEWRPGQRSATPVERRDYGNVETRLTPRRSAELLKENHAQLLTGMLGEASSGIDVVPDSAGTFSSLRIQGLEVGRLEGLLAPRVYFGLEGSFRRLDESRQGEFRDFLRAVREFRRADSADPQHEYYRLQSERWLESLLSRDITLIDASLSPQHVYSQVPAFTASARGVIDLLSLTRGGRLAVVELKLHEEINLPLQGLDYWLRVNWLNQRQQFQEFGYFQGCELSAAPPLLYLVSPAFRFHSSTGTLLRCFHPQIEPVLIGINDSWRKKIKVLFRHGRAAVRG